MRLAHNPYRFAALVMLLTATAFMSAVYYSLDRVPYAIFDVMIATLFASVGLVLYGQKRGKAHASAEINVIKSR